MTHSRLGLAGLATVTVLALSTSEASAQYLPPQYFAPGYGAYYSNYGTPSGGVVNRTSYTTPFGTTYNKQYYNPYTGYGNNSTTYQSFGNVSSYSSSYGNYNTPYINPAFSNYYNGRGYVYPMYDNFGNRIR